MINRLDYVENVINKYNNQHNDDKKKEIEPGMILNVGDKMNFKDLFNGLMTGGVNFDNKKKESKTEQQISEHKKRMD